jgi:flagellar hook-length control protein FliK
MIHAHSEHGPRLDAAWTKDHGPSHAHAMDGVGNEHHGKHSAAAVTFTIMPVGTAQVVSTTPAPVSVPATMTAATTAAVVAPTEGEAMTAPLPAAAALPIADASEAGTAPEGDGQEQDAPKTPVSSAPMQAPAAAKDAAAPATNQATTADTVEADDDVPAPVQATSSAPTERPKDVGHTRVLPAHSPTQLAHELVDHLRVAVREEGREIQIHLRPAELGNMTIRVTMLDGVLQAHIAADRPESARLLEQSLSHLQDMLADRGYEMGSLDVNTGGPDARETGASAQNTPDHERTRGRGHDHHNHGDLVGAGSAPEAVVVHDGDVNVLA